MEMNNVTYITRKGFLDYWNNFYNKYCELKEVKDNAIVPKENVISLIGLLKNEGFEIGRIHSESIMLTEVQTVHYCKLFQSHSKRCNYEIVVRLRKFSNKSYEVRISKTILYPRSHSRKMKESVSIFRHTFLSN